MGENVIQKILRAHLKHNTDIGIRPGDDIEIFPDDTLTQDASGVMVWLEVEAMGLKEVKTRSINFIDHNTVQMGFENADDHTYLYSVVRKYGAILSKVGNGICHSVYLERFARPGRLLLGADSHTTNAGGLGTMGIGVGGLSIALCLAGKPYSLVIPSIIGVELKGKLNDWVTAKDLIIKIVGDLGTKNKNKSLEYFGEGVLTLSVDERATVANMGAECGVTTSIFPSDQRTLEYLKSVGRQGDYVKLVADKDALYDEVKTYDLSDLVPMVVLPPKKGDKGLGKPAELKEALGVKVNQVCVGSCTNSSYHDLKVVAESLKTLKVHPEVELIITPGSRSVLELLIKDGSMEVFNRVGARVLEPVCGPCLGQGFSPGSKGVRLATFNRNFVGRSGTWDAEVYLASPEVAVATAITGAISDPREVFSEKDYVKYEAFSLPTKDDLLVKPEKPDPKRRIKKGPNISKIPSAPKFKNELPGVVVLKLGDRVTTDDIAPAGPWLRYRSNIEKYAEAVFSEMKPGFNRSALKNKESGVSNFIVAGEGYGEGSAKEHAALMPMFLGVRAVIAKSFQRIHMDNLVNFGLIPLVFVDPNDYKEIDEGDEIVLKVESLYDNKASLENITKGVTMKLKHTLNKKQVSVIKNGGSLNVS